MSEMAKAYDPKSFESRWYERWEREGHFRPRGIEGTPSFTIVIPPPNVTGALTIGHVLNNTIQDVLIRWQRMQGFNTLWLPGTDHAGIATQNVVKRDLEARGQTRRGDRAGSVRRRGLEVEGSVRRQDHRASSGCSAHRATGSGSVSHSIRVSPKRSSRSSAGSTGRG